MPEEERLATISRAQIFPCIQCGKCTGGCPVALVCKTFNVRRILYEVLNTEGEEVAHNKEYLWYCSTCGTCMSRCPKGVDPMEAVRTLRSVLVEEGAVPKSVKDVFGFVAKYGNVWGMPKAQRSKWAEGLEIKTAAENKDFEYLLFVGDSASYVERNQETAKNVVKVLQKAGVNFAYLGNEEASSGNEILRMGEIGLFETLADQNIQKFKKYNVKKIVTLSPHGFHALKNEYPKLDPDLKIEVVHYTQLLSSLLKEGKLTLSNKLNKKVAYHDSCYLGKHNSVYDEPRTVLQSIPDLDYVEFNRCRERGLCCEGGGGRMWVEAEGAKDRTANLRVRDALDLGVEVIATACSFCLSTLEDAIKFGGHEEKLKVMDIMEIIGQALD